MELYERETYYPIPDRCVCVVFFFFLNCGSIGREMLAGKMLAKSRAAYGAFYTAWQLGK